MWSKIKSVLKVVVDVVVFGRSKGWWSKDHTIPTDPNIHK